MAECHPIAFRFVMQAKQRGATIIHVDPRFTRTSALADIHLPIRAGTDIAFVGGLIHYVLENDLYFKEYVLNYTNAATLINPDFKDAEDLDGLFSGFDPEERTYDFASWLPQGAFATAEESTRFVSGESRSEHAGEFQRSEPKKDETLQDPNCVFQILKRHFSRYTPEMVARICGIPEENFHKVAQALTEASGPEKTASWCYAVGWTHHTTGVQMIRSAAILQALLGNTGRPGGGLLALRGHATIQGSTDVPTLYDMLPGYLTMPALMDPGDSLEDYIKSHEVQRGWWSNMPKYIVSLLKAWYGEAATKENGYGFNWVPKIAGDHSQLPMTVAIADGVIKGLFVLGQNPAVGGHNTRLVRKGLANLEWMVVRDFYETETASFWRSSPEVRNGELDPAQIATEVFYLPAATSIEKDGSYTNTHRLIQFHHKAVEPPADSRAEPWFVYWLGKRLKELYADSGLSRDAALHALTWNYPTEGEYADPKIEAVLKEINGYTVSDNVPVSGFADLKSDGSTACGCWIYSGVYPEEGKNLAAARVPDGPDGTGNHLGWGFAWPANRRILYNRAAARPDGTPWSERKKLIWWDPEADNDKGGKGKWVGADVPDFPVDKAPDFAGDWEAGGMDAHPGTAPFIMKDNGLASLFAPTGVKDGPLPTHYEPVESPVENPLYGQQDNPAAKKWRRKNNKYHKVNDPQFPYVITSYRLTEHHTGGMMSRALPWLVELQPQGFCEVDRTLAADRGLENGGWAVVWTQRGEIETRVLVTDRLRPLLINGRQIHQVGMPFHFGYLGIAQGGVFNDLSALVGDPSTTIHEGKVFTCNIRPGRLGDRATRKDDETD